MKKLITALMLAFPLAIFAQIPEVPEAVCAHCGVLMTHNHKLMEGVQHKKGCPYYESKEEEHQSTSLKDYTPAQEKPTSPTPRWPFIGGKCPECGRPCTHDSYISSDNIHSGCRLGEAIKEYWHLIHLSLTAKKKKDRDAAWNKSWDAEQNILKVAEDALKRKNTATTTPSYSSSPSPTPSYTPSVPSSGEHLSSVNIRNEYDKKLTNEFKSTAYGKTYPNGREEWVLYDYNDKKIGEYAKVEMVENYFKVRDFQGNYGLCDGRRELFAPQFGSIEVVYEPGYYDGKRFLMLDVTKRGSDGLLKHGLLNPNTQALYGGHAGYILPCEYDRIELTSFGNAKVTKNRRMGIVSTTSTSPGKVIVKPEYEYLNTYYVPTTYYDAENRKVTRNTVYYIVGNGGKFGAWDSSEWHKDLTVPMEYTIDQVKSILDKR